MGDQNIHLSADSSRLEELEKKVAEIDKHADYLGAEVTELKEKIAKLENLHKDELL